MYWLFVNVLLSLFLAVCLFLNVNQIKSDSLFVYKYLAKSADWDLAENILFRSGRDDDSKKGGFTTRYKSLTRFIYLSAMKTSEVDELFPHISMSNWQGLYIF